MNVRLRGLHWQPPHRPGKSERQKARLPFCVGQRDLWHSRQVGYARRSGRHGIHGALPVAKRNRSGRKPAYTDSLPCGGILAFNSSRWLRELLQSQKCRPDRQRFSVDGLRSRHVVDRRKRHHGYDPGRDPRQRRDEGATGKRTGQRGKTQRLRQQHHSKCAGEGCRCENNEKGEWQEESGNETRRSSHSKGDGSQGAAGEPDLGRVQRKPECWINSSKRGAGQRNRGSCYFGRGAFSKDRRELRSARSETRLMGGREWSWLHVYNETWTEVQRTGVQFRDGATAYREWWKRCFPGAIYCGEIRYHPKCGVWSVHFAVCCAEGPGFHEERAYSGRFYYQREDRQRHSVQQLYRRGTRVDYQQEWQFRVQRGNSKRDNLRYRWLVQGYCLCRAYRRRRDDRRIKHDTIQDIFRYRQRRLRNTENSWRKLRQEYRYEPDYTSEFYIQEYFQSNCSDSREGGNRILQYRHWKRRRYKSIRATWLRFASSWKRAREQDHRQGNSKREGQQHKNIHSMGRERQWNHWTRTVWWSHLQHWFYQREGIHIGVQKRKQNCSL
ncbi:tail fiber protein [Klebsiella phage vB_KshKPC-M]|nr:tail fiber protein [Klebsiella phage vB_KshKPC-M]